MNKLFAAAAIAGLSCALSGGADARDTRKVPHAGATHTEKVGSGQTVTIGANRTENVGSGQTTKVKQNRTETVGQGQTITVKQNRTETVDQNQTTTVGRPPKNK